MRAKPDIRTPFVICQRTLGGRSVTTITYGLLRQIYADKASGSLLGTHWTFTQHSRRPARCRTPDLSVPLHIRGHLLRETRRTLAVCPTCPNAPNLLHGITTHFSERFSMDASEDLRYSTEPSLFDNTGTLYRNGGYITNTFNADFTARWTPIFSSLSTFSNTIVNYESSSVCVRAKTAWRTSVSAKLDNIRAAQVYSFVVGWHYRQHLMMTSDRGYTS